MAKITKGNTPPVMLPALDSISAAPVATLPSTRGGRHAAIADADRAFANAIAAAWGDGTNAAVGSVIADKSAAAKMAAMIKRLCRSAKVIPEGKIVATRVIARDGGFSWAVALADPKPPKAPDATA